MENDSAQGFCRRCGLSLPAVRLASEGRVDEALAGLGRGSGNLSGGALIFAIGLLNALVNGYFEAWQSALISALAGAGIGAPLIAAGIVRVRRAERLLNTRGAAKSLDGPAPPAPLPEATAAAAAGGFPAARESVTEHTTLKLEAARPPRRD